MPHDPSLNPTNNPGGDPAPQRIGDGSDIEVLRRLSAVEGGLGEVKVEVAKAQTRMDSLATKEDLEAQGAKLTADIHTQGEKLTADIHTQGEKLTADITAQGEKLFAAIAELTTAVKVQGAELNARMDAIAQANDEKLNATTQLFAAELKASAKEQRAWVFTRAFPALGAIVGILGYLGYIAYLWRS